MTDNGWGIIPKQIKMRLTKSFKPLFLFYFICFIIGGSSGIWIPYLFESNSILLKCDAIFTYGFAIIASLAADVFLLDRKDYEIKVISMLALVVGLLSSVAIVYGYVWPAKDKSTTIGTMGVVSILIIWMLTYANDSKFEKQDNYSPLGGEEPTVSGLREH